MYGFQSLGTAPSGMHCLALGWEWAFSQLMEFEMALLLALIRGLRAAHPKLRWRLHRQGEAHRQSLQDPRSPGLNADAEMNGPAGTSFEARSWEPASPILSSRLMERSRAAESPRVLFVCNSELQVVDVGSGPAEHPLLACGGGGPTRFCAGHQLLPRIDIGNGHLTKRG